jgi:hypothetical protein
LIKERFRPFAEQLSSEAAGSGAGFTAIKTSTFSVLSVLNVARRFRTSNRWTICAWISSRLVWCWICSPKAWAPAQAAGLTGHQWTMEEMLTAPES